MENLCVISSEKEILSLNFGVNMEKFVTFGIWAFSCRQRAVHLAFK